jgi:hypothetical protein
MKRTAKLSALSLVLLFLAALGCERDAQRTPPESPDTQTASGVPPIRNVQSNEDLLESQRGRTASTNDAGSGSASGGSSRPAGGVPVGDDPVEEVKQVMRRMAQDFADQDAAALASHFQKPAVVQPLLAGVMEIQTKQKRLEELITGKLGMDMSEDLFEGPGGPGGQIGPPTPPSPDELTRKLDAGDFTFTQAGDTVLLNEVSSPGEPEKFIQVDGRWKMAVAEEEEAMFSMMGDVVTGMNRFLTEMIEGIESDEITRDNLEQRGKALGDEHVAPAMAKMMQMIFGGPGGPGGPGSLPPMGDE